MKNNILRVVVLNIFILGCNLNEIDDSLIDDLIAKSDSLDKVFQSYNIDTHVYKENMRNEGSSFQEYWGTHFGEYSEHYRVVEKYYCTDSTENIYCINIENTKTLTGTIIELIEHEDKWFLHGFRLYGTGIKN